MAGAYTLDQNLGLARLTVAVVQKWVPLVANWDERVDTSAEGVYRVEIGKVRSQADADRAERKSKAAWDAADRCVYGGLRADPKWGKINAQAGGVQGLQDIQVLADLADHHGCGNCGELTALAFMYLYRMDIRPLDFMALLPPADHAFVVIGRQGKDLDPRTWGTAAVCDPWAGGVLIPLKAGESGPLANHGDAYVAYQGTHLEQKMTAMHAGYTGVTVAHRES